MPTETGIVARGKVAADGVAGMRGRRLHRDTCRLAEECRGQKTGYH